MKVPSPIERYSLSSCDLYRTFPSLNQASFTGPLDSPHPELLKCDPSGGVSIDLDLISGNSTEQDDDALLLKNRSNLTAFEQLEQHWEEINAAPQPPMLLESRSNLTALQQHWNESNHTGLTIAAWFTPSLTLYDDAQPIFTIGGKVPFDLSSGDVPPGCPGHDFQIYQQRMNVLVSYSNSEAECSYIGQTDIRRLRAIPTHIAVTIDSNDSNFYVNGESLFMGNTIWFDTTLQHWNMTTSSLQLFTAYTSKLMFGGAIHQIDIFDQFLMASQIAALHEEGIISVPPSEIKVAAKADEASNRLHQYAADSLSLNLGSWNTSSTVLMLEVELLSLPQHGIVTLDSVEVTANSRFPVAMGSSSIALDYKLKTSDYFNVPAVNAYNEDLHLGSESFNFRVLAFNAKSELIAKSPTVAQNVHVVHINHPGTLTVPDEAFLDVFDPTLAVVTGIDFADPLDYNMDRVRVDLWAEHGQLSLQPAYRPLANFDSRCHVDASKWQCVGDGIMDQNMTFLAIPNDIPFILRNLGYQSLSPGTMDKITIRVSDGSGGMCLDETEHAQYHDLLGNTFTSIRDECFQIQAVVGVPGYEINDPVNPNNKTGSGGGIFDLSFLSVADLLFWGLIISIVVACVSCFRGLLRCFASGRAVEVDDNSVSENVCKETPAADAV
jgi:Concanavalin A-like lectin/glucanases superfamily